jgi:hypothetical protein
MLLALVFSGTVTLTQTANAGTILAEVSRQSGLRLEAAPDEAKEILIVSLHDAPIKEVMDECAWATFGWWNRTRTGFRLEKDNAAENHADQEFYEESARTLARGIADCRKDVLHPGLTDDQASVAAYTKVNHRTTFVAGGPEVRLLATMLGLVDAEQAIDRDSRVWPAFTAWSNVPTAAEHALGPAANDALHEYAVEKNIPWPSAGVGPPLIAVLTLGAEPDQGSANLQIYDRAGGLIPERMYTAFETKDPDWNAIPKQLLDEIPPNAVAPRSEASKLFQIRMPRPSNAFAYIDPSEFENLPKLLERLRNPERFEPMATAATDAWLAIAGLTHRNLVACLDDVGLMPIIQGPEGTPLRKYIKDYGAKNVAIRPGWVLARPLAAHLPRGHQVDRAALGRFARANVRPDSVGALRAAGDFLAHCGLPALGWDITTYTWYASDAHVEAFPGNEWDLPWAFGLMPSYLQEEWLAGEPIDIGQLPEDCRFHLGNWARPLTPWNVPPGVPSITAEPTHGFNGGLPANGWLRADRRVDEGFMVRSRTSAGAVYENFTNASGVAQWLKNVAPGQPALEFVRATRTTTRLWADLGPGRLKPSKDCYDDVFDPAKYADWNYVSADIKAEVEVAQAKHP